MLRLPTLCQDPRLSCRAAKPVLACFLPFHNPVHNMSTTIRNPPMFAPAVFRLSWLF